MLLEPPYIDSLVALIEKKIAAGVWRSGDYLPKNAQLAEEYEISEGTVRNAIDRLKAKGVLRGHQGKGVYVI